MIVPVVAELAVILDALGEVGDGGGGDGPTVIDVESEPAAEPEPKAVER